jgi:hypothetical protein
MRELKKLNFLCTRIEPVKMNQTQLDEYWPKSWATGARKQGMMSLHRTTVEKILPRTNDVIVFEDDIQINKLNKSYIQKLLHRFPNDNIIRLDCWGYVPNNRYKSCSGKSIVRNCWCGGTHATIYRTSKAATELQNFYKKTKTDIDCALEHYKASLCVNENTVSTKYMESTIPKTI